MLRVPWDAPAGFILTTFQTTDPDSGAAVAADSLPTALVRDSESPYTSAGAIAECFALETGVYGVRLVTNPLSTSFDLTTFPVLVVSVTVGGVSQKLSWVLCPAPTVGVGEIMDASGAPTYEVKLYPAGWPTNLGALTANSLIGSLLCTSLGEVKRITGYSHTGAHQVTLESALVNHSGVRFWITTI